MLNIPNVTTQPKAEPDYKSVGLPPDLHRKIKRLSLDLEISMIEVVQRSIALFEVELYLKGADNGGTDPAGGG